MFYDVIVKELKNKPIIIYGAGDNGIYTYDYLKSINANIECFCDKDLNKCGLLIKGIICKKFDELNDYMDKCIIVTPRCNNAQIVFDIKKYGFKYVVSWEEMQFLFHHQNRITSESDLVLEGYLKKNEKFKNMYVGKRCFIVGTGPSINEQNLACLKNEIVFTVNNAFKIDNFECINTNFHIYIDSLYFQEDQNENNNLMRVERMKKIGNKAQCFFPYSKSINFVKKYNLEKVLNINFIEENVNICLSENTMDFQREVALSGTVIITAIMLAIYMGFSEIYLVGCDCTDILTTIGAKIENASMTEYAFKNDNFEQKHLQETLGKRSLESIYHIQYIKFKNFRILNEICNNKHIKLFNCTKGGILDCLERKQLEEIINEELIG